MCYTLTWQQYFSNFLWKAEVGTECVSAMIYFKVWLEDKDNTLHHKKVFNMNKFFYELEEV